MMLALLAASAVHWITVPDVKTCDCGYVGWKLDEKRVVELDRRLELPEGAYSREEYARYYSGHIAPDGAKTLFVTLRHKQLLSTHPKMPIRKPNHIYIQYRSKGEAPVGGGVHMGCLLISGEFDAEFKPITPMTCSNKGI